MEKKKKFRQKQTIYIGLSEMNDVLKYISENKSVYLRKKREDEYFLPSKCWIDVEPRNMTILY